MILYIFSCQLWLILCVSVIIIHVGTFSRRLTFSSINFCLDKSDVHKEQACDCFTLVSFSGEGGASIGVRTRCSHTVQAKQSTQVLSQYNRVSHLIKSLSELPISQGLFFLLTPRKRKKNLLMEFLKPKITVFTYMYSNCQLYDYQIEGIGKYMFWTL